MEKSLKNRHVTKVVKLDASPKVRKIAKSGAQRQREYLDRERRKVQRMTRIAEKAENVNAQLKAIDAESVTVPTSLFVDDVEKSLDNLAEHLREAAQARINRKRRKT